MFISEIKQIGKFKYKIITEEGSFFLSGREMVRYGLKEEEELSESLYGRIKEEVLLPEAKRKAMDLLVRMDHSEKELRGKLALKVFSEDIIDEAVSYVKSFNYINDERYAENYVTYRGGGKSKRQIGLELQKKGIDKERAEDLIAEAVDEEEVIMKLIKKKMGRKKLSEEGEKRKLMGFLYRRGFESELIQSSIRRFEAKSEEEESE